ncbi:MAG: hypothetical protein KME10_07275 [Plectolyngbya sp. WJT66-NPBG17]|jgi:hypothetical protein|nr:hypothetical protein [Plectolyngbya sp. WJT66-NPBG17]MBW4525298.1 hypothetical protein [Phormidium tanganyikae FI6-MK23]
MIQALDAIFDGTALHPQAPLNLAAGARVRITVETLIPDAESEHKTFLQTAKSLQLEGDPDWSETFEQRFHGDNLSENA